MVFFTFTACQNEDPTLNVIDEPSQENYDALINTLRSKVNTAIDTRSATLTQTLNANIENFNAGDASLENSIIATALDLEMLDGVNVFLENNYKILASASPSTCTMTHLHELTKDYDFWSTSIVSSIEDHVLYLKWYTHNSVSLIHESIIWKFNNVIATIKDCNTAYNNNFTYLFTTLSNLQSYTTTNIEIINSILGITGTESTVLNDIDGRLETLEDFKANRFELDGVLRDLKDVYEELIAITDALDARLTQAEVDIFDLQQRVEYIENTEIPAIWEGMEFLYEFISDVYTNLDTRVTGLTFKPEYDFGGGLSNLILVRGLSEWENESGDAVPNFKWQQMQSGHVYKGITYLTYNVSPANAKIDPSTLELVYTTTKIITRSNSDPLLKILESDVTFINGILIIPVVINEDLYPLVQTSFDVDATENIKVALKLTNEGYTAEAMPVRPESTPNTTPVADSDDRAVVSSEYVTVWLGLFEGHIAKKEVSNTDEIGPIFPTEFITSEFVDKNNKEFPTLTLWAGTGQTNLVNVADSILDVYYDGFEKAYRIPANYNFNKHELHYELIDLNNSAINYVELTGSTVTIKPGLDNQQNAIGKTVCVQVTAEIDQQVYAIGFVRILIVRPDKETVTIETPFSLAQAVLNCGGWNEFTKSNTVSSLVTDNILNKSDVNEKTGITQASVFYSKYKTIEVNSVNIVATNNAILPTLTDDQLKKIVKFEYVTGTPYIKGTISNMAPFGEYTVVTTLSSEELIPDLVVTWKFTIATPQLRPTTYLVNNTYVVSPTVSEQNKTAFSGLLDQVFLRNNNGKFLYNSNSLSGTCPDYITPDFLFAEIPTGYNISIDGKTVLKSGEEAAKIVTIDGKFYVQLIEGAASYELVNNPALKIIAKGSVNGGVYTTYQPFSIVFTNPINLQLPNDAAFTYNLYVLNIYKLSSRTGSDVIFTSDNQAISLVMYKEAAELLINRYGIDYTYDQSFNIGSKTISSPLKLDLENIMYASGNSNVFNNSLSSLGAEVTISIEEGDDFAYYNLNTPKRYGVYFNANGATLPSNLRISIPVTIKHRWGYTQDNLIIKVN